MHRVSLSIFAAALVLFGVTTTNADTHWNQFRGSTGDGISAARGLPVEFDESKNCRWKTAIHGKGWSSPVVWGNRIWLTTAPPDGKKLSAVCVDAITGKIVHDVVVFEVEKPQSDYNYLNTHASPTPVVEKDRLYVHFGSYGTACLDTTTGKKLWQRRDLRCNHRVRAGSSPIVDDKALYAVYDGIDVQFVVALDKKTGKTLWKTDRNIESDLEELLREGGVTDVEKTKKEKPGDNKKAYATPTLIEHQGRRQLIAPAAMATVSYDPLTGKELWRVRHSGWGWNSSCRPLYKNGLVYFTTGVSQILMAVRPTGRGDITESHVVWSAKRAPSIPSPVVVDDLLVMVGGKGFARCVDAKTGKERWRERVSGTHWASPIVADGKLYLTGQDGTITVLAMGETFERLAKNRLDGEFNASPAVVGKSLILRSSTHLYCFTTGHTRKAETVAKGDKPKNPKKGEIDWDKAYEKLLKENPAVRKKVENGAATKADVIAWMKKKRGKDDKPKELGKGKKDWDKAYEELLKKNPEIRANVANGDATKADIIAWMKKSMGMDSDKGKGKDETKKGTGFYAIVIGRLKTKDVELGEFSLIVDHVTSMYGNRWVKEKVVGKRIKVTGVTGEFLDKLLLIKRGETLKFRSGAYDASTNTLTFGFKFHVLERTKPFDPAEHGIPPKEFRGFRGVVRGKIIEAAGYEALIEVAEVEKVDDASKSANAKIIQGKRIRLVGFYRDHAKAFGDLNVGDIIRIGARHANPTFDEFEVTDVMEKVAK